MNSPSAASSSSFRWPRWPWGYPISWPATLTPLALRADGTFLRSPPRVAMFCVVVVVVGDRDATGAAAVRRERKVSDAVRGEIQEGAAGEDGIVRDGSRVFARS